MRKLLLASFAFEIAGNRVTDQRIIAIESTLNEDHEVDQKHAYEVFNLWWQENKTEEQTLIYVICHPTIDGTKQGERPKKTPAPDYGVYSAHPLNELPQEYDDQMSRTMVVDMDGLRTTFQLAFYDFDDRDWIFLDGDTSLLDRTHAKWIDILPFADR